jgi:hypothetical protein
MLKVKRWIYSGELDKSSRDKASILDNCGSLLDKSCSHEILGEVVFEGDDEKFYVITVEAVIAEGNPDYIKSVLEEEE